MNTERKSITDRIRVVSQATPPPEYIEGWANNLRNLAMEMEEGLKNKGEVSLPRPHARIAIRALWDLADRMELD